MLERAGISVEILTGEEMQQLAKRGDVTLLGKKKAPETVLPEDESSFKGTVVSDAENIIRNRYDAENREGFRQ